MPVVLGAAVFSQKCCMHRTNLQISPIYTCRFPAINDSICSSSTRFGAQPGLRDRAPKHRGVSASAAAIEETSKAWWDDKSQIWVDVTSREEFAAAIEDSNYEVVLVDWYASWCRGCKRAYPELTKMAASESFKGRVKFVKVCVDNLKALARENSVKVLPLVSLFRPGHGFLVQFQAVPSKLKITKNNIKVILDNPTKFFTLDPNGIVVVRDDDPNPGRQKEKEEAKKLRAQTGGLFEKLMASSSASSSPTSVKAPSPSVSAVPATPAQGNAAVEAPDSSPANTSAISERSRIAQAKADFLREYGDLYGYNGQIDALYHSEVGQRMSPNEHYLDYTGSSLYCNSVLQKIFQELQTDVFGNPHSANPSSTRTSERIEAARDMVLNFFNASPSEYQLVFTKCATGALQTTGETFPWSNGSVFRYTRENHNSVLGIREYALKQGGRFQAVEEQWVESWISGHKEGEELVHPCPGSPGNTTYSLFAFPAEENFSGKKYPLRWIREIQAMSTKEHKWKVLLDAAAFAPTQPLDLSAYPADFVTISFYKMFGFPTGLGALLLRTDCVDIMKKVFWGGGTVALATSSDDFHVLKCKPSDKFEDGTVAFLDILSLPHTFDMVSSLGGVSAIQDHTYALTRHLFKRLSSIKHSNGRPVVQIFGSHSHPAPREVQGPIVNFEILDPEGSLVSYRSVESEAAAAGFHIRTGIHCNPGAAYHDVGVSEVEVESLAEEKEGCDDEVDFIEVKRPATNAGIMSDADILPALQDGEMKLGHPGEVAMKWVKKPLGSVRVSLGYMSTFEDVETFCIFVEKTYVDRAADAL